MHDLPADVGGRPLSASDRAPCVLVVDDELVVRDLLQRFLALEGYRVLGAADGLEALALFRRHSGSVQAVILDVLMPRMDGHDAFFAMRALDPTIPVLVMSGFAAGERAAEIIAQPGTTFVRKPFVLGDVLVSLEGLLRNGAHPVGTWRVESTSSTPRLEGITD